MTENLRAQTLNEAARLVNNDRNRDYGEPIDDFSKVADALTAYGYSGPGGRKLLPHDIPFIQTVVKLSRLVQTPDKADSWVDIAGYAACGREVAEQEKDRFTEAAEETIKELPDQPKPDLVAVNFDNSFTMPGRFVSGVEQVELVKSKSKADLTYAGDRVSRITVVVPEEISFSSYRYVRDAAEFLLREAEPTAKMGALLLKNYAASGDVTYEWRVD